MALIKCKECGGEVSNKAAACPKCGAKVPKETSLFTRAVAVLAVFVVGSCIFKGNESRQGAESSSASIATQQPVKTPEQIALEAKADGEIQAAIVMGKAIKASMKNPASFKLKSFLIYPGGATCYEYSGANSFNAVIPGRAVYLPAKTKVLTQDADGNRFVKAWNDICTKSGGAERAKGLNQLGAI